MWSSGTTDKTGITPTTSTLIGFINSMRTDISANTNTNTNTHINDDRLISLSTSTAQKYMITSQNEISYYQHYQPIDNKVKDIKASRYNNKFVDEHFSSNIPIINGNSSNDSISNVVVDSTNINKIIKLEITGVAKDYGGGRVGGVEVTVDGGYTWHQANGTEKWSYVYQVYPPSPVEDPLLCPDSNRINKKLVPVYNGNSNSNSNSNSKSDEESNDNSNSSSIIKSQVRINKNANLNNNEIRLSTVIKLEIM
jgi:hypothetical protein